MGNVFFLTRPHLSYELDIRRSRPKHVDRLTHSQEGAQPLPKNPHINIAYFSVGVNGGFRDLLGTGWS